MNSPEYNPFVDVTLAWRKRHPRWPERYFAFQATLYFTALGIHLLADDSLIGAMFAGTIWMGPTLVPTLLWITMLPDTTGGPGGAGSSPTRWKPGAFERLGPDLQRHVSWHNRAVVLALFSLPLMWIFAL